MSLDRPQRRSLRAFTLLSWQEQIGSTIVHVLDYVTGEAFTVATPAKGAFMRLRGRMTVGSTVAPQRSRTGAVKPRDRGSRQRGYSNTVAVRAFLYDPFAFDPFAAESGTIGSPDN